MFVSRQSAAACLSFMLTCYRKESEINNLNARLEDEQSLVAQLQKKIKEQQVNDFIKYVYDRHTQHTKYMCAISCDVMTVVFRRVLKSWRRS